MTNIQIETSLAALFLFLIIIVSLTKNSMSIKSSVAWLLLPFVFLLIAIFPDPLTEFAHWLGFETFSNFIFLVVIASLIIVSFFLTVQTSRQQKQITKLNQELAIIKHRVSKKNN